MAGRLMNLGCEPPRLVVVDDQQRVILAMLPPLAALVETEIGRGVYVK
jgi:hypothetical protein